MKKQLHPGVKWAWRFASYFFLIIFMVTFGSWLIFPIAMAVFGMMGVTVGAGIAIIVVFILLALLIIIVLTEVYVKLAYDRWFYEFDEHGIRLERGIIWKRYSNVPYERIQNVDIHRGIIARMLGFSSLLVQTAGYSAQPHAEGSIPAVDIHEAEKIREFVLKRITKKGRHQGL